MPEQAEQVEALANEIAEYLSLHPDAADTVDGIVLWWLERHRHFHARALVESALQHLLATGVLERVSTSSGTIVYARKR